MRSDSQKGAACVMETPEAGKSWSDQTRTAKTEAGRKAVLEMIRASLRRQVKEILT